MEQKSYRKPNASSGSAGSYRASGRTYASQSRTAPSGYGRTASSANRSKTAASARPNGTAASSNRSGSAPARPMPRRRRHNPANVVALIVALTAVLAGVVYTGSAWLISTINASTYCSNIYVNGIDISPYSKEQGLQYVREQIDARLNSEYILSWEDNSWAFTAADFGGTIDVETVMDRAWNIGHVGNIFDRSASIRALKRNPIYLEMPLVYDEDSVDTYLDEIYSQLYVEPRNAEVAADLSNPYLAEEAASGRELDRDAARMQVVSLLETGEGGNVLPVMELKPAISTETAMNSLELIVDYTTDVTARGYNGRFNVRKALMSFYGMIVQPGEVISFNDVVGPRTQERGWQEGTEYIGGGRTQQGYGGGVCQASTTLYGALLKAGMTIMQRSPHSMTVAYVDPSIDAAVTNDSKDLVFCNNTDYPITIYTEVTKEVARVQIFGARPAYRYEMESIIIEQASEASKNGFIEDTDGTHCYYTDEFKLYKTGIPACMSQGYLVAYDWDTGEEVSRHHLSNDAYSSGYNIYWRGIHTRDGGVFSTGAEADGL